jgi:hypothetical protein
MNSIQSIIGDYKDFISHLLMCLSKKNIEINNFQIDHLCYRTKTLDEYNSMKKNIMLFSKEYVENIHHGRPITKFLLIEPLKYKKYSIPLIELPAPQKNIVYNSGLEHLEIVVGDNFNILKNKYKSLWTGSDDSGVYNQTIFIDFDEHKVKFHQYSLLEVLKLENRIFIKI